MTGKSEDLEALYLYIEGYTDGLDNQPDGAFWQMHVEAVESYNEDMGGDYDWYDVQQGYIEWHSRQVTGGGHAQE